MIDVLVFSSYEHALSWPNTDELSHIIEIGQRKGLHCFDSLKSFHSSHHHKESNGSCMLPLSSILFAFLSFL